MVHRRWLVIAGSVALVAIAATAVIVGIQPRSPDRADGNVTAEPAVSPLTPVCGFPGELVSAITAERPRDDPPVALGGVRIGPADTESWGMWATDRGVLIQRPSDAVLFVERFGSDGTTQGGVTVDVERTDAPLSNGTPAIGADGSMYVIDAHQGRRDLVRFTSDGERIWDTAIPKSSESTDHPLDLSGATWVADKDGAPAILVTEGSSTTHVLREDGAYVGAERGFSTYLEGADGSTVFGYREVSEGAVEMVASDMSIEDVVFRTPLDISDKGRTPTVRQSNGFAIGPGGEGILTLNERGLEWFTADGIRRGVWLYTGDVEVHQLVHHDNRYWLLADVGEDQRLLSATDDEMATILGSPVNLNAANERDLAILGLGIGVTSDAVLNHFDAGEVPRVVLRAEPGWGALSPDLDASMELVYSVRGDPRLSSPVVVAEQSARLPIEGGDIELEVPDLPPGPYEVSASIVDQTTREPVSGQCFRFTIGAPEAPLDLGDLAEGTDWGGAAPLRGIQIAGVLGVGSHRVQLDFGRLVENPTSQPSADSLDWMSVPGAVWPEDGTDPADPITTGLADLTAAAAYATANNLDLIVQVGQGGDAETAAVESGTWEGWVELLVTTINERAPGISTWAAWNEPNMTYSGADYTTMIEQPFVRAVHSVDPDAMVLAGNTLNIDPEWWADAVAAGICDTADAIGVHPYTGWARSWEEEGYTSDDSGLGELREILGTDCSALPLWDTESGWTSDGDAAYWAQASNIARKLLWYNHEKVAGWTYFFSEGGWGENGLSWSLIQHESYVKAGALAFASVSRQIEGRGRGELVDTGIPNSYALRFPGDDELVAVWTDDMRVDATVTATAEELELADQYGATTTLPLVDGQARLTLTGAPLFLRGAPGTAIAITPTSPFGPDLLTGRPVTASSTNDDSDASIITSGTVNPYRPWRSGNADDGGVDPAPSVEISLASPTTIDRIAVASGSIVCCESGLRDYTVSVRSTDGEWVPVAVQEGQFTDRVVLFTFEPIEATAVRVEIPWTTIRDTRVPAVNFTGFAGGLPPPFMGLQAESDYVVAISAVQAWAVASQ